MPSDNLPIKLNGAIHVISAILKFVAALVGNVGDMSAHVAATPTLLAKNQPMPNVTNAVTGFMTGSCVG